METLEIKNNKQEKSNFWKSWIDPTSSLVITLFTLIFVFPIFLTLYGFMPPLSIASFRIDHILLFIILFTLSFVLFKRFSKVFYLLFSLCIMGLVTSNMLGYYGFMNLYHDYSSFIYNLSDENIDIQFKEESNEFPQKTKILAAIDYRNEEVKNQSNTWAVKNFKEYKSIFPSLKLLHCFSIFKEVKSRWNYVYDPKGVDYYSKTSATISHLKEDDKLKGDCDDYSILLAGLMTAVGGEVQLVRTSVATKDGKTIGHLYPELKIGSVKDLEKIAYLIKNELFINESKNKAIFYYIDTEENVWLNMDYNDNYPGGKYQSKIRKSVLTIE